MSSQRFLIRLNRVDAITLCGLALAGLAIWLISRKELNFALCALFLAMLADALDGHLARRWRLEREFGRYLDGFVDTFVYLVTPALWLWTWGFNGPAAAILLFVVWACGIVRLAVFNIAGNDTVEGKLVYTGMPVFWLLFLTGGAQILSWLTDQETAGAVLYAVWPAAALLMVWNRPFFKFSSLKQILVLVLGGAGLFLGAGIIEAVS